MKPLPAEFVAYWLDTHARYRTARVAHFRLIHEFRNGRHIPGYSDDMLPPRDGAGLPLGWSLANLRRLAAKRAPRLIRAGRPAASPLPRLVGECYVFMRENHDWHGCEVAVLSIEGERFTVARSSHVASGLLAPAGSKKRKLKTWTCTHAELW